MLDSRPPVTHVRVQMVVSAMDAGRPTSFRAYQCDVGQAAFDRLLRLASASRMHCCGNPRSFKAYYDDTDLVYENHALDAAHGAASTGSGGQPKRAIVVAPARVYSQRLMHTQEERAGLLLCTHWVREARAADVFPCCTARIRDVRYKRQLIFTIHHLLTLVFEVHRSAAGGPMHHQVYVEYVVSADADRSIAERRLRTVLQELGTPVV